MGKGKVPKKASSSKKTSAKKATAPKPKKTSTPKPKAAPAPEPTPAPETPVPEFVKTASPAERKAAVEALVEDSGLPAMLQRAPWKRPGSSAPAMPLPPPKPAPATAPAPAKAAPAPKPAAPTGQPRVQMMKPPAPALERPSGLMSGPRPVILDTNALMMQFQFHIDIERELKRLLDFRHEIIVPRIVVNELESLAKEAKGKDAGEARMAIELAKTFKIVDSPGAGDTGILRLAEQVGAIVVTNDKILRARLRAKDVPNIYMRSSAFLTVEGHITGI